MIWTLLPLLVTLSLFRDITLCSFPLGLLPTFTCKVLLPLQNSAMTNWQWNNVSVLPSSNLSSLLFCSLPNNRGNLKTIWFLCGTPSKLCLNNFNYSAFFTSVLPVTKFWEVKSVNSSCTDWDGCRGWKQKELMLPVMEVVLTSSTST